MPVTQLQNPAGVYGQSRAFSLLYADVVSGESTNNIAIGELVVWMTTANNEGSVLRATTAPTGGAPVVAGFALDLITPGGVGRIVVDGLILNTAISDYASPAAGDMLTIPTTTTGRTNKLASAAGVIGQYIGVVIEGSAQGAGNVIPLVNVNHF